MAGLTAEGLVIRTADEVRENINAELRDEWGPSMDLSDEDPIGFLVGIFAAAIGECWEVTEAVHNAWNPDAASGAALESLCLVTGTIKPAEQASSVTLTLTGTPTTVVSSGRQAQTSTGVVFATLASATIAAATAWSALTAYVAGDVRTNASRIYLCITSGTSAGSGGPTTTAEDITDGSAHWRYLGEGTGYVDVAAAATETGALVAASGDITTIVTPVGGWSSVINVLDADLGTEETTDEELRALREIDLARAGTSTIDALREALLDVDGVTAVRLFVNDTDVTDVDGVPPHAIEALVLGGDDQDIIDAIGSNIAGGIATYGTETGTWTDSEGNDHTINFSRATAVPIYIDATFVKDPDTYPDDGDDQGKTAIVDWGDAQATGKNAVASAIAAQIFGVDGVIDVTSVLIGTSNPPVASTTILISLREIATYDRSRITFHTSDGTP